MPVSNEKHLDYCRQLCSELRAQGFEVELDDSSNSLNKKVRNAQLAQFNYIAVAGDEEVAAKTADIRSREGERVGKLSIGELEDKLLSEFPEGVPLP